MWSSRATGKARSCFLLAGRLQAVDYTEDGKEIGLNLFSPGSFFGELTLIDGLPRSASIMAIEASAVAFLPRREALALVYGKPAVAERMLRHFADCIRRLTVMRGLLAIPDVRQRLCALLRLLKQPMGKGQEGVASLPTQRQIAIMINTSRESVSRALASLERQGIIERNRHALVIRQPEELERIVSSDR
jgi:CRP/FNR family cyclic AMP-dependent transcriptional regulator